MDNIDYLSFTSDQEFRSIREIQYTNGLLPVQWVVLRYLTRANKHSLTPSLVANFLGTTKGTVSQTLYYLEKKGYICRTANAKDKRVVSRLTTDMLKIVKSGDVVNVHSMDRLARNTQNLLQIVEEITGKGAEIKFHKEGMVFNNDENNPFSQLMLTMIGAFSEFERNIMLERQREGIAIAKSKGKYKGRKTILSDEQLAEMKSDFNSGTMKKTEIAKKYNLTRARIYQLCA